MFFVVALGNLVLYFTLGCTSNVVAQRLTYKFRLRLFRDFLRQDSVFFDNPANSTGALAGKLSEFPTQLQELLGFNLSLILIILINLISSSVLGLIAGWKLGLVVVFGALPPVVFAGYLRVRLEVKLDNDTSSRFSDSAALAAEAVSEIRTVVSFTLERHILEQYQEKLSGIAKKSIKMLLWTMFWFSLTQSISLLGIALGFW
jgi:ATP-binding cassette, subfamily B (MDR/TAP), member 1